ncbi:MAG: hypothetical protein H0X27_03210 [Caulobacteraceae bacterium]|nr:hypothetical protein [Caulobacteraceae bacterium]
MDRDKTQQALNEAYAEWKSVVPNFSLKLEEFTAPFLLKVTQEYADAKKRVLILGQETGDWCWDAVELRDPKNGWDYPEPYPYKRIETLAQFVQNDDSIKALIWGYGEYRFASAQPKNRRSGFWPGFHRFAGDPPTAMAANVAKCHSLKWNKRVPDLPPSEYEAFAAAQKRLLRREIEILQPDLCIFQSGPDYDRLIRNSFANAEFIATAEPDITEDIFARVEGLPAESYRTYHPAGWRNHYQSPYRVRVFEALKRVLSPEV